MKCPEFRLQFVSPQAESTLLCADFVRHVDPPSLSFSVNLSGLSNGFVLEEQKASSPSRQQEPRRRCASESSISSSSSLLGNTRYTHIYNPYTAFILMYQEKTLFKIPDQAKMLVVEGY